MDSTRAVRWSATGIGLTTLYFAGWALLRPESLGRAMGVSREHAHLLGYRDLVSAALLLTQPSPAAFALRAAADAMDVVTLSRTRPGVAVGAAVFGAWSAAAGWSARSSSRPS
jgi:hypothetical protein